MALIRCGTSGGGSSNSVSIDYNSSCSWSAGRTLDLSTTKKACGIVFKPTSGTISDMFWATDDNNGGWCNVYRQNGTTPTFKFKFNENSIVSDTYWSSSSSLSFAALLIFID